MAEHSGCSRTGAEHEQGPQLRSLPLDWFAPGVVLAKGLRAHLSPRLRGRVAVKIWDKLDSGMVRAFNAI